ncbi:hypothetical protein RND81_14G082900 [Saponaria officinalis]|uniref:Aminotransferase-like plant mobile domain-containing protein n=1 Tax=Saponaria officinalis TaxID=3572 RepID=A0AAW1GRN7_SAPOF
MARGKIFSLAVPVMASVYRGLRTISTSPKPSYSGAVFPVHYLYGWLAYYFRTHHQAEPCPIGPPMVVYSGFGHAKFFKDDEARKLIHEGRSINLGCFMRGFDKGTCLCDDGTLSREHLTYFICLRTAYLPLRQGRSFILEPYGPYRFGKQFGFFKVFRVFLNPMSKSVTYLVKRRRKGGRCLCSQVADLECIRRRSQVTYGVILT